MAIQPVGLPASTTRILLFFKPLLGCNRAWFTKASHTIKLYKRNAEYDDLKKKILCKFGVTEFWGEIKDNKNNQPEQAKSSPMRDITVEKLYASQSLNNQIEIRIYCTIFRFYWKTQFLYCWKVISMINRPVRTKKSTKLILGHKSSRREIFMKGFILIF